MDFIKSEHMKNKLIIVQAILCVITAFMLIASALMIYRNGIIAREADPAADIYTVQVVADYAKPVMIAFIFSIAVTIACAITGAKDKGDNLTVKIKGQKNLSDMAGQSNNIILIRIIVLALAILFIIVGILNGSMSDVFIKASKICTECIGLG